MGGMVRITNIYNSRGTRFDKTNSRERKRGLVDQNPRAYFAAGVAWMVDYAGNYIMYIICIYVCACA